MKIGRGFLLLALAGACGTSNQAIEPLLINAPSQVAFACYGPIKGMTNVKAAQPIAACDTHFLSAEGNNRALGPSYYGLTLESSPGRIAVINVTVTSRTESPDGQVTGSYFGTSVDSDNLTPTKNAIPVGTIPVDIDLDPTGCFAFTTNAGSCDLSRLEVAAIVDQGAAANVERVQIKNGGGQRISARPAALVTIPRSMTPTAAMCPSAPMAGDIAYMALPSCHLVAGVDLSTGTVVEAIQFAADGTATVAADAALAALSCPVECPDAMAADGGPVVAGARPVTIDMKLHMGLPVLAIGADNSNRVTTVTLDATGRLADAAPIQQIPLEGFDLDAEHRFGLTRVRMTDLLDLPGVDARFVYAVANDGTVRVARLDTVVADPPRECNTQVDPRELLGETDVNRMACPLMERPPPGMGPMPRRNGARSPGIQLPDEIVPLDVAFHSRPMATPSSATMLGDYAYITATDGRVYIVTINDLSYPDFYSPSDPLKTMIPLALSHQLRDGGSQRDAVLAAGSSCAAPELEAAATSLGPRALKNPVTELDANFAAANQLITLPRPAQVTCVTDSSVPVSELSYAAPLPQRATSFPDIMGVLTRLTTAGRLAESWSFVWEGPLAIDNRRALFVRGAEFRIEDPAKSLCSIGAEPFDILNLNGCNPNLRDSGCGVDETCFVHPNTPASVRTGVCIPRGKDVDLTEPCRNFMASLRQYTIGPDLHSGSVSLLERKRVLRTEPLAGCTDANQCNTYYQEERGLRLGQHPVARSTMPLPNEFVPLGWACEQDTSHAGRGNQQRCVMTCDANSGCEPGYVCSNSRCVSGALPPPECLGALQAFTVSGGESLVVRGTFSGYLHNRGVAMGGDTCEDLTTGPGFHRLNVGRVKLSPNPAYPECSASNPPASPCTETFDTVEKRDVWQEGDATCVAPSNQLVTRTAIPSIRFENRAFVFHLTDLTTTGDRRCTGDRLGELSPFATLFPGFRLVVDLAGGFLPMQIGDDRNEADFDARFPVTIESGPLGALWVLDEAQTSVSNGTVYTLDPDSPENGFRPLRIR